LDRLEPLLSGSFTKMNGWQEASWGKAKIPKLSWEDIARLLNAAMQDIIEFDKTSTRFKKPEKYSLKDFLIQNWKNPQNPWSPFLFACFGAPSFTTPVLPGKNASAFLAKLAKNQHTIVEDTTDISNSIFED